MKNSILPARIRVLVALAFLAPWAAIEAATLYVKPTGDDANDGSSWALAKQTIDGAISAASQGDTILVTNGIYGAVTMGLNQIKLFSVNGPAVTIIDGGGAARCVDDVYEGTLQGFTLRNGYSAAEDGGGARISNGGIDNCTIQTNSALNGGGLYLYESTATWCRVEGNFTLEQGGGIHATDSRIDNCQIFINESTESGGGAYLYQSTILNSLIFGNGSRQDGGGVYIESAGVASNCQFLANNAWGNGGGAYAYESQILASSILDNGCLTNGGGVYLDYLSEVDNCTISNNGAVRDGGGVWMYESTVNLSRIDKNRAVSGNGGGVYGEYQNRITSCFILYNTAATNGGGIYTANENLVRNSLIAANWADDVGGGVYMDSGSTLESATVVGNSAGSSLGSGIFVAGDNNGITNGIIYFNQDNDIEIDTGPVLSLFHCCYDVVNGNVSGGGGTTNNPLFVNAGSGYGTYHVAGDYRLQTTSPCVDTGTNQAWMVGAQDLAGSNRIIGASVNMGAYETTGVAKLPQTITFPAIANQTTNSRVGLAATASSGLPVSFSVASGQAAISGGTNLSFSAQGQVTIRASQAGNTNYDAAPNVDRSFYVTGDSFTLRAFALTNNAVLRWTDPYDVGFSNQTVLLRFSTADYPAATNSGTQIYKGTDQVFTHEGLTPGQPYYYTIWCSHDGDTFVPPPGGDEPPSTNAGPVTVFWYSTDGYVTCWRLDTNGVLAESILVRDTPVDPVVPSAWVFGGVADINKDRRPEIFWSPSNATMKTWFLDANYQYSSNAVLYGSWCPPEYQFRCSGDSSGDGDDDLFYEDVYFGYIDTWHVKPDGTLRVALPTYASSVNRSLQLRDCGDVSGDGRVELFFHNTNSGATEVWFMDTNGQQTAMLTMNTNPAPNGWQMVCAGDVSGDGLSEIFWQHANGRSAVWFLDTNGTPTATYDMTTNRVAAGWRMVDKADVNSDGRVELLWHNTNGATMVWFLNADGRLARQQEMSAIPMASKWRMMGGYTVPTP